MKYKILVKDDDTGEWRDMDDSDGLDMPNSFTSQFEAENEAKHVVRKCSYRFPTKIVPA